MVNKILSFLWMMIKETYTNFGLDNLAAIDLKYIHE